MLVTVVDVGDRTVVMLTYGPGDPDAFSSAMGSSATSSPRSASTERGRPNDSKTRPMAADERTEIMTFIRLRGHPRLALAAALLALATLVPIASAQDEPAFVFPCADGVEWAAAAGQPISFFCGWGTQGGPGLMTTFLKAHRATLIILDEDGDTVLSIGPARSRRCGANPESFPSGFEDVTCAGPTGQSAGWSYLLEGGLPEGTYTVILE